MLCGCVLFISAQYSLSQRDVETCCEGWVGKGREGLLVSGLLGLEIKSDRAGNAAHSKTHVTENEIHHIHTHTHTHTHAQTSGFPVWDRVQCGSGETSFRHSIALGFNLILRNHSVPITPLFRNSIYLYIFNFCPPSIASILFSSYFVLPSLFLSPAPPYRIGSKYSRSAFKFIPVKVKQFEASKSLQLQVLDQPRGLVVRASDN